MTTHDVISAFLDNEPFDARELSSALATDEGRAMLIDLVALRHLISDDGVAGWHVATSRPPARVRWFAAAAAAIGVALAPDKGSKTRQKIREGFDDFKKKATDAARDFADEVDKGFEKVKTKFDNA